MWLAATALIGSSLLPLASPGDLLFADDFEDGSLYAWSSSVPAPAWWQRQEPSESCPEYVARFQEAWDACPHCDYWRRSAGTASGHACNLLTGDEYTRPIFFSDFEFHWLGWTELVNPGGLE